MKTQDYNLTTESIDVNSNFISFFIKNNIEIPLIQRDYVQGSNLQSEKRDAFIDSLYKALINENDSCELDFIYGTYDNGAFLPLDGQQRLTTLYLLHWFLFNKCRIEAPNTYAKIVEGYHLDSRYFSYKTRRSSTAFCQKLMVYNPKVLSACISENIMQQTWFSEDWKHDPSVIAMLEMLDALNAKFNQLPSPDVSNMLNILLHTKSINFDQLDMGSYKLTDSLYVKMNARGKQLTEFENWKAKFIQYIEEHFDNQNYMYAETNRKKDFEKIKDYFTHSIEHEWTDLFWTYAVNNYIEQQKTCEDLHVNEKNMHSKPSGPLIDSLFLNFYYYIYRILFFVFSNEDDKEEDSSIHGTEVSRKTLFKDVTNIEFLFRALDLFVQIDNHNDDKTHGFFNELFYLKGQKTDGSIRLFSSETSDLFDSCIRNKASVDEQILLFCIIKYCIKNTCYTVTDNLKKYVRVCRNLLESINQRLTQDMKIHSNVRFSQLSKYLNTINDLCAVSDISTLPSIKGGMGDVTSVYSWMRHYPNPEIYSLEDTLYTHGSLYAFDLEITLSDICKAFHEFKAASDLKRVRLLVAFGYKGANFGECAHGIRRFMGYRDRWDVLFRYKDDVSDLKLAFTAYVNEYKLCHNIDELINNKLHKLKNKDCFAYYFLNYDAFANSSLRWIMNNKENAKDVDAHYFFAEISDYDLITFPRFSRNPLLGYHTEPYSCAVAQYIRKRHQDLYIHMDYTGKDKNKAMITFDNNNVQILCTDKGWNVLFSNIENDKERHRLAISTLRKMNSCCIHYGKGKHYIHIANKDRIESAFEFIKLMYGL